MHRVLDLSLGQRSVVVDAPVDRLQPAIDEAFFQKAVKSLQGARFVVARHGFIGRIPAAYAGNSFKLRGLQINVLLRIGAASIQNPRRGHFQFFAPQLLIHLDFDRQSVAIEAGNVGRVETRHGLRLDDKILQPFVQCVAQVNGAVGVGRAVVQQEIGAASLAARFASLAQFFIKPH